MNKVGQALHEQRMSLGISIEEASNKTKIQKVYLEAIEKGDFAFFKNQEFYQQVFVGSYAKFLNLDKNELIDLLDDDNKAYLQNPSVDAFTPKHAEEIIEREHQELEAQVEPVHDDFEIVEEAVPAKEEEINEEVDDRIESRHSNPHVLEKYMYQIEDPKLKEIEDQIKRKKEEEALNELNQPVIADEIEKETTEAPQVEGDLKLDEVNEEVLNDNEVEDNEAEEVNNIDINNIAPASEINLDNLDNTGRDISSLLDEIERSEDNFKEEPTIGELIDENKDITNETTIDSQSELEDLLSSLNNQVIVNEEQMVQDSDNNEELLNSDIINDVEIIKDEEFIATKEDAQPINDINLDLLTKPVEGNTEIINLTSGIDLEVINDSEKTKVKNDIFKSFDESLLNGNDAIKAEDSLSKTAIDLKVAKALGETKIDKEDLGKIKKEKVVNIIFMILIIALLCYLGYLIFRFVQGQ